MRFELQRVDYMPDELKPGILYASAKFGIALHLCACGCGAKIRTPLGPTEWAVKRTRYGPTLWPSVGNWQQRCQSHYYIRRGEVIWCEKWTPEEIVAGRADETQRLRAYFETRERRRRGPLRKFLRWLISLFNQIRP